MREHRKHPEIFSGLRCSIPLPKLNHFFIEIIKSNGFTSKKTENCKRFWRRRRQPKILIYIFSPDIASYYWNTQCFFVKISMKTTFSSSNDEDSPKIFISKLENRENFHDLKFFSQNFAKSHKIRKENARFFMKYSRIQKKKNARGPLQNCHNFADVIRRKTQAVHGVLFMLSHTAARPAHIIFKTGFLRYFR